MGLPSVLYLRSKKVIKVGVLVHEPDVQKTFKFVAQHDLFGGITYFDWCELVHFHVLVVTEHLVVHGRLQGFVFAIDCAQLFEATVVNRFKAKLIFPIQGLCDPPLAFPGSNTFEVCSKVLVHFQIFIFLPATNFDHAFNDRVCKNLVEQKHSSHNQEWQLWSHPWQSIVVGHDGLIGVIKRKHGIVKNLLITKSPVAEQHHKNWRPFESLECCDVQFVIIHWRLLEKVSNQDFLSDVQVKECKRRDGIQYWKGDAIHKCDENRVQDCCVLEMHKMFWTAVQGDVLLLSYTFGLASFAEAAAAAIKEAVNAIHASVHS